MKLSGWIFFFLLYVGFCSSNSIFISEIYFDGRDEWIELYNGGESFSGVVTFQGLKSSVLEVNVSIESGEFLIISDDSSIQGCKTLFNQSLSLTDTKEISISIEYSSFQNTVSVSEDLVKKYNDQKKSFQLFYGTGGELSSNGLYKTYDEEDGMYTISPCIILDDPLLVQREEQYQPENDGNTSLSGNLLSGSSLILSGDSFQGAGDISGESLTGSILTGSVLSGSVLDNSMQDYQGSDSNQDTSNLEGSDLSGDDLVSSIGSNYTYGLFKIKELYAKSTHLYDEYIIIEFLGDYSGLIHIDGGGQGSARKSFSVNALSGDRYFLSTHPPNYVGLGYIDIPGLSLTDGGEIITLLDSSNNLIDEISYNTSSQFYAKSFMSFSNDTMRLFETNTHPSVDPIGWSSELCNSFPTLLFSGSSIIFEGDKDLCVVGLKYTLTNGDEQHTYNLETCRLELDNNTITSTNSITTSILFGEKELCSKLVPIIVLDSNSNRSEEIIDDSTIGTGSIIITEIHPQSDNYGEYIELYCKEKCTGTLQIFGAGHGSATKIIDISGYGGSYHIIKDNDNSLIDGIGVESFSLTDGGEIINIYRHDGQLIDTVVYSGSLPTNSSWYRRNGSLYSDSSSPGFDNELLSKNDENGTYCSIIIQNSKPFYFGHKVNLIGSINGKHLQNSTKEYSCKWFGFEDASTYGCNPPYISFEQEGIHTVGLLIENSQGDFECKTELSVNYPDLKKSIEASSKYYQDLYKKRKDQYGYLKNQLKKFNLSVNTSGDIITKNSSSQSDTILQKVGVIEIYGLLPNPAGKDSDQESIILSHSGSLFTGSYNDFYIIYEGSTAKKYLSGDRQFNLNQATLHGSLSLKNKASCINLYNNLVLYDTFCYGDSKDDEWKYRENTISSRSGVTSIKFLDKITLTINNDEVCIEYEKAPFRCKSLQYSLSDSKKRKSDSKKLLSLEKKLTTSNDKILKSKQQVTKYKNDLTNIKKQLSGVKKHLGSVIKLQSEYIYENRNIMRNSLGSLYYTLGIDEGFTSFQYLLSGIESGEEEVVFGILTIPFTDYNQRTKTRTGKISKFKQDLQDIGFQLGTDSIRFINGIRENLDIQQ